MPIQLTLPDSEFAEISLFGPGIGECIVLHFGDGRWFVIDSCLCPETKQPIALNYLKSIGVDVERQVIGILITHWHLDHIEGALALLKACKSAKLYHTAALTSVEALHLAAIYKKDVFASTDKEIREFKDIVEYLFKAQDKSRVDPVKARHTFFDHRQGVHTRMVALSPSPTAVTQAIAHLVTLRPKEDESRIRNAVPVDENLNAVAIHFSFGSFSALLGSDLEETGSGNIQTGWSAVFQNNIASDLSLAGSSLFKVPHHGSANGHHERVWSDLLLDNPLSITTPFSRSGLPKTDDIDRVTARSSEFLVTRDPASRKNLKRDRMVDRELNAIAKEVKVVNEKMGHIQIRASSNGELSVAANESCVRYT